MPLNTEMPSWLGERANWDERSANNSISTFQPYADYIQGKQQTLKTEGMKLNLASAALGIQQQEQSVDLTKMKMQDQEQGMKEFPEWLKETGGDPKKMIETPWNGTSQSGSALWKQASDAAWMKVQRDDAIELKKQQVQNQLDEAKAKVNVQTMKNKATADYQDRMATVAEEKLKVPSGSQKEFEALQADYEDTVKKINSETDQVTLTGLLARKKQDEDRMDRLSKFAGQIATTKTTETKVDLSDAAHPKKTSTTVSGPVGEPAPAVTGAATNGSKKEMGGYKIGAVYKGGLQYLGGDPNSESSWKQAK